MNYVTLLMTKMPWGQIKGQELPRMKLDKKYRSPNLRRSKSHPGMVKFWSLLWWGERAPATNWTDPDQALVILGKTSNTHYAMAVPIVPLSWMLFDMSQVLVCFHPGIYLLWLTFWHDKLLPLAILLWATMGLSDNLTLDFPSLVYFKFSEQRCHFILFIFQIVSQWLGTTL